MPAIVVGTVLYMSSVGSHSLGYNRVTEISSDIMDAFSGQKKNLTSAFRVSASPDAASSVFDKNSKQDVKLQSNRTVMQEIAPNKNMAAPQVKEADTRVSADKAVSGGQIADNKQAIGAGMQQTARVQTDMQNTWNAASGAMRQQVQGVAAKQGFSMGQVDNGLGLTEPSSGFSTVINVATRSLTGGIVDALSIANSLVKENRAASPGAIRNMVEQAVKGAENQARGPAAFPGEENKNAPAAPRQIALNNLSLPNAIDLTQGVPALARQPEAQDLAQVQYDLQQQMAEQMNAHQNGNKNPNAENIAAALERQDEAALAQMAQNYDGQQLVERMLEQQNALDAAHVSQKQFEAFSYQEQQQFFEASTLERLRMLEQEFGTVQSSVDVAATADLNISGAMVTVPFSVDHDTAVTLARLTEGVGSAQHMEPDPRRLVGNFQNSLGLSA